LWNLGYTGWIAWSSEEARRHLSAPDHRVDAVLVCTSTGGEGGLQLAIEAATTRPELRILVILDLERRAAPVVIAWRLARLPNTTSMIELAASSERIVSRVEALLCRPAPLPHPTPVDSGRVSGWPRQRAPGATAESTRRHISIRPSCVRDPSL
jgi:hypothetical protein